MADELYELAQDIEDLPEDIQQAVYNEFSRLANVLESRAKAGAPVRTGRLRSAVQTDYTRTGIEAYVNTGVAPYAPYVQDPFMSEAFAATLPEIDASIDRAINRTLDTL